MKLHRRMAVAIACGAVVAAFAAAPALAASTATYAASADGTGLSISLSPPGGGQGLALDLGISHGELASTPTASGSGAGIVQAEQTVAETSAPPNGPAVSAELTGTSQGDPNLGSLAFDLAKGTSSSHAPAGSDASLSSENTGEVVNAVLTLTPGATGILGTAPFSVRSDANVAAEGTTVTASGSTDEVVIPVQIGTDIVTNLCDPLAQIDPTLGQACKDAVAAGGSLTEVARITILPAEVECSLDTTTNTASVPTATAALLEVSVFGQPAVTVPVGQTVDIPPGPDPVVHAVVGDTATSASGGVATATASGIHVDLFPGSADAPQISLVGAEASCGVNGEAAPAPSPSPSTTPQPPLPRTGAPLVLVYLSGTALLFGALGLMRYLRRA